MMGEPCTPGTSHIFSDDLDDDVIYSTPTDKIQRDASTICLNMGYELATYDQVEKAWRNGLDSMCYDAWVGFLRILPLHGDKV